MNYSDVLNSYIDRSGLTQDEISRLCREAGIQVTQSYISRLRRGKVSPASEHVNRIIARVCKQDEGPLLLAAAKERSPELIRNIVEQTETLSELLANVLAVASRAINDPRELFRATEEMGSISRSIGRLATAIDAGGRDLAMRPDIERLVQKCEMLSEDDVRELDALAAIKLERRQGEPNGNGTYQGSK